MLSFPPTFSLKARPWQQERGCSVWSVSCSGVPDEQWCKVQSCKQWFLTMGAGTRAEVGAEVPSQPPWQGKGMAERSQASQQVTEASAPEEKLQTCCGLPLSWGDLLQKGWCYRAVHTLTVGLQRGSSMDVGCCAWERPGPSCSGDPTNPPGLCSAINLRGLWRWTSKVYFGGKKCCNKDLFVFWIKTQTVVAKEATKKIP